MFSHGDNGSVPFRCVSKDSMRASKHLKGTQPLLMVVKPVFDKLNCPVKIVKINLVSAERQRNNIKNSNILVM